MKTVSIVYNSTLSSKVLCEDLIEEEQHIVIRINRKDIKDYIIKDLPDPSDITGVSLTNLPSKNFASFEPYTHNGNGKCTQYRLKEQSHQTSSQ